jgi:limonene-1,2-epoxide hydrolase
VAAATQIVTEQSWFYLSGDPEYDLLVACCTNNRKPTDLHALLNSTLDWERVFGLSEHHRVRPALFTALAGRPEVPESIHLALRARSQRLAIKGLRFAAEFKRIWRTFAERGIEVLAHKGPVLGQYLLGDPAMRQYGDLDFLIRPADVARARVALAELGFRPKVRLSARQELAYLNTGYEHVFGSAEESHLIELQWQIVPRFYSIDFDIDALFARSMQVPFEGTPVRMLGKEDLLLVLCVHASKHEWNQLGMIRDIAMLAGFELNWDWIQREACKLGIARVLNVSLVLARDLLRCPLPSDRMSGRETELLLCEKLARQFEAKLRASAEDNPESLRYFRKMIEVRERWRDRARFAWRLASTPSDGEWEAVKLPDSLFPLYGSVRAVRLLRRASRAFAN